MIIRLPEPVIRSPNKCRKASNPLNRAFLRRFIGTSIELYGQLCFRDTRFLTVIEIESVTPIIIQHTIKVIDYIDCSSDTRIGTLNDTEHCVTASNKGDFSIISRPFVPLPGARAID